MLRIRENLTFRDRAVLLDPAVADQAAIQSSFVVTNETRTASSRILARLTSYHHKQSNAFLFTGASGVGKSHLLRFIQALLADPSGLGWEKLLPFPEGLRRPHSPQQSTFFEVPPDPAVDLGHAILSEISEVVGQLAPAAAEATPSAADFARALSDLAPFLLSKNLAFVALEGISARVDRISSRARLESEIQLLKTLAEVAAESGTLVFFVADDRHLQSSERAPGAPPLKSLAQSCDLLWLSRGNIAEIVASAVAPKSKIQRSEILRLLSSLRNKLPLFGHKDENFSDLYPVHPQVFNGLFDLRSLWPKFSILGFVQSAIRASLDRPAEQIVALSTLFDLILPDLRADSRFASLLSSYDEFQTRVLPRMRGDIRPRAVALLKGITIGDVCAAIPATVKNLANCLLLFDESDVSPGYSLAAAILLEMEQRAGNLLAADGERLERSYHLRLPEARQPSIAALQSPAIISADREPGAGAGTSARIGRPALPHQKSAEDEALNWAALLSGLDELRNLEFAAADRRLRAWWTSTFEHEAAALSDKLHPLPEILSTTRLWKAARAYEETLALIRPTMLRWLSGEITLANAMAQLRRDLGEDTEILRSWRRSFDNLGALVRWLPSFEHSAEYVTDAFSLGPGELDDLRLRLLQWVEEPQCFLEADHREAFDLAFKEFKELYVRLYSSLHEEALNVVGGADGKEAKVDPVALRNLEILSGLRFTDQSYLHRVRIIGKWLQRSQCLLPIREILDRQARCLCSFNPEKDRHLTQAAAQIQTVAHEGIAYFRSILEQSSRLVLQELKTMRVDEGTLGQITALVSGGATVPLAGHTVEVLNKIITKHATEFLAIVRVRNS